MKLSLNTLAKYIAFDTNQLEGLLNQAGLEVEERIDCVVSGVVVGEILEIAQHPDADRLVVCQLDCAQETPVQIVTGATNIAVGDKVPVALHGAVLHQGFKIKKSKLRGQVSNGMMCSTQELGLSDEAKGIWILPNNTTVGADLTKLAGLNDTVLDVAILPNRGDCASYRGISRELAALSKQDFNWPEPKCYKLNDLDDLSIHIEDNQACPYYSAYRFSAEHAQQASPLWMQVALMRSGMRPVNVAVDITNFVCLEWGQPLHAFDYEDLKSQQLSIGFLNHSQLTTGLDAIEREVDTQSLVIKDGPKDDQRIVALAGVMGSMAGSVNQNSSQFVLEAAYFDAQIIRKAAAKQRLKTESSFRFERHVDPEAVEGAAHRALELFEELLGAKIFAGNIVKYHQHSCFKNTVIDANIDKVSEFIALPLTEGFKPLERLGFCCLDANHIQVPSWRRFDTLAWPDLAEELIRLNGLDGINSQLPQQMVMPIEPETVDVIADELIDLCVHQGFEQCLSFSMVDPKLCESLGLEYFVELSNPLSLNQAVMRPCLLPNFIQNAKLNLNYGAKRLALVEEGMVFDVGGVQKRQLGLLCLGPLMPQAHLQSHQQLPLLSDVFVMKGYLEAMMQSLGVKYTCKANASYSFFHPNQAADIVVEGLESQQSVGYFGQLHPQLLAQLGIKEPVSYLQLNLDALPLSPQKPYASYSNHPSIRCDLAFLAPKALAYQDIVDAIEMHKSTLCVRHFLFDCFEDERLEAGKKSMAIGFVYQAEDKSLCDEDVQPLHHKLCETLLDTFPIEFR